MKKIKYKPLSGWILGSAFIFLAGSTSLNAQLNQAGSGNNVYGRTNVGLFGGPSGTVRAVGIGNFLTMPSAAFHINANLLPPAPADFTRGQVFRTDAPAGVLTSWSLFTGTPGTPTQPGTLLEKGMIFSDGASNVPGDRNNFQIQATNGHLTFHTGNGPILPTGVRTERMRINDRGFVGINTPTPHNLLEINAGAANTSGLTFTQLTSSSLGPNAGPVVLTVNDQGQVILVEDAVGNDWHLDGNSAAAADFIGTINTEDFRIRTDNIQRMVVNSAGNVGIGTFTPSALFHTNGTVRFENLSNNNGYSRILVTDGNGNVAWRDASTLGSGGGGSTVIASNGLNDADPSPSSVDVELGGTLSRNTDIEMSDKILELNGNGTRTVFNENPLVAVRIRNTNGSPNRLCHGLEVSAITTGTRETIGVQADASGGDEENFGAYLRAASPGNQNYGGVGYAQDGLIVNAGFHGEAAGGVKARGIYGMGAQSSTLNYGGYFVGSGPGASSTAYGSYNIAVNGATNIGVYGTVNGTPAPSYAGYFDGSIYVSGMVAPSDQRLKQNVNTFSNAQEIIQKLEPKTYTYRTKEYAQMALPREQQYGLIAQELEKILPELVSPVTHPAQYDEKGNKISEEVQFKGINYIGLIPILIQNAKEQQETINALVTELDNVRKDLSNIRSSRVETAGVTATLEQNIPNPSSASTSISYFIPETTADAVIMVFDMNGQLIKKFDLREKGKGSIVINAGELTAGMYMYSLIADDKEVDTKRMILTK